MPFDHTLLAAQFGRVAAHLGSSFSWTPPGASAAISFPAAMEQGMVEDLREVESRGDLTGYILTTSTVHFAGVYPETGDILTGSGSARYEVVESVGTRHPSGVVRIHTIAL